MTRGAILDSRGAPMRRAYAPGGYSGAGYSTSRSLLWGLATDSHRELTSYTRTELLRKARFFKKNFGMVRGVAKSIVDHSVGPGIFPLPCAADPTWLPEELDAWNARAWAWICEMAKVAEVSGRMTLWEAQRVRTAAKFWDGELFTMNVNAANGWPQFQLIRAHNCGQWGVNEADGWRDGVQVDSVNRARAYRFRLAGDDNYATIAAASVTHSYLLEDSDAVRGVTPLAHAINNLHDILDTLLLEKESVKENSRVARTIYTESGEEEDETRSHFDDGVDTSEDDVTTVKLEAIFGAEIQRLKKGERMEEGRSDRPSPAFTGFLDYLGRDVTQGASFPYEFAWNLEALKGPGVRAILEKVRVAVDEWRRNEIEDTLPYVTFALAHAIKNRLGGLTPAPVDWWRLEWIGGAEDVTIDKGRDAREDRENIRAALDNFKRYYARRSLWWKTELRERAVEAGYIDALAKEFGVSPDRICQFGNSAPPPAATDPAADPAATP